MEKKDIVGLNKSELIAIENRTELLELVLRGNNEGIWDWSVGTGEVYFSPTWEEQLGYAPGELEPKFSTLESLMHPDDLEKFRPSLKSYLSPDFTSDIYSIVYRLRHKSGGFRWILSRGAAKRDSNGAATRMAGSHADISELIEPYLENDKFQRTVIDKINDAFVLMYNGVMVDVNDSFCKITGYTKADLATLKMSDLMTDENASMIPTLREKLQKDGSYLVELYGKRKDGSSLYVETSATILKRNPYIAVFFFRDVSQRKKAQDDLMRFQNLMRYVIEHNRIAVAVHDKKLNYMYVSQPYIELFNLQGQEIIGKHHYDVLKNMPEAFKEVHRRVLNGEIIRSSEAPSAFDVGKSVFWECRPWYDEDNSIGGFILYIEDITERKKIEKLLITEKENFKTTLLSMSDAVISTDIKGNVVVMNPIAERLTGWSLREAAGRPAANIFRIVSNKNAKPDADFLSLTLKAGRAVEINDKLILSKKGSDIPTEISIAPIKHNGGSTAGSVIIFRDVSEKRAEQRKIEFLSYNDVLTGLFNRRYIEDAIKKIDTDGNIPITIFSIDVNGLKLVNDAFGHEFGDQLLKTVASILKIVCSPTDIIGRMGGDEFCILIRRSDETAAIALKERILREISNLKLYPVMVSLAIGFAVKKTPEDDLKTLMTVSDNRMYQDKIKTSKIMRSQTIQMALDHINSNYEQEQIHTGSVSCYCEAIAKAMGLSDKDIYDVKTAGALHDIGKIMIPSQILSKKGSLTNDEYTLVKRHPEIGYQMLKTVEEYAHLSEFVLYHHERFDGMGYPVGLKGSAIPLASRIIAVADSYEAMTAKRPYHKIRTPAEAVAELRKGAGGQFDPEVVNCFVERVIPEITKPK